MRPADRRRLSGGQLRPTDRAMAARSARMSSSEEESRSTEEKERLMTKRCIVRQWKNTWETLFERGKAKNLPVQTVTSLFFLETYLTMWEFFDNGFGGQEKVDCDKDLAEVEQCEDDLGRATVGTLNAGATSLCGWWSYLPRECGSSYVVR